MVNLAVASNKEIYCSKCKAYIKTERFGDCLNPDDMNKLHNSLCDKCKDSPIKRVLDSLFSNK